MASYIPRSAPTITLAAWKALFLREAVDRLSKERSAWFWLLVEPAFHILSMMMVFTVFRVRVISGIDVGLWIMIGLLAFFMFRRPAQQSINAISANLQLFTYRQVKPVDAVLVRSVLEGFLMLLITFLLFALSGLAGILSMPADPLLVMAAFFGLWLYGLGFGLVSSVASELMPELGRAITMSLLPIYLISGVMFPPTMLPPPIRDWMMLNPLVHGVEAARLGFAPHYRVLPDLSVGYLYACALTVVLVGIALHVRFSARLASQ